MPPDVPSFQYSIFNATQKNNDEIVELIFQITQVLLEGTCIHMLGHLVSIQNNILVCNL
jgi:hypothetical protein